MPRFLRFSRPRPAGRGASLLHALWLPGFGALGGCLADHDGRVPGDPLGSFAVTARLESSDCGEGAMGAPELWEFEVRLSREHSTLFWLNGQAPVEGKLDPSTGRFEIESTSRVEATPASRDGPGCVLLRHDRAVGTLLTSEGAVTGFTTELGYHYSVDVGRRCAEWIGVTGGFARLPCAQRYRAEARRVD